MSTVQFLANHHHGITLYNQTYDPTHGLLGCGLRGLDSFVVGDISMYSNMKFVAAQLSTQQLQDRVGGTKETAGCANAMHAALAFLSVYLAQFYGEELT